MGLIQVLIVYDANEKDSSLAQALKTHLKPVAAASTPFDVVDINQDVLPGDEREAGRRRLLECSQIWISLLSAEFLGSAIGRLIEGNSGDHRLIPLLARPCKYENSPWGKLQLLPRNCQPLHGRPELEAALVEIVDEIGQVVENIAREPSLGEVLSNSMMRREQITALGLRRDLPLDKFLQLMESMFRKVPHLRITGPVRSQLWEQMVDYLDACDPAAQLKEWLYSESEAQFKEQKQRNGSLGLPVGKPPARFCPSDPLVEILSRLDPNHAARWLYLGMVYVGPRVFFPEMARARQQYELADRLRGQVYWSHMNSSEQEAAGFCERAYAEGCPSLLAILATPSCSSAEFEQALKLVCELRAQGPVSSVTAHRINAHDNPTVLNLLGARALWFGDCHHAVLAYVKAQQRASQEHQPLAEWIACWGELMAHRWREKVGASQETKSKERGLEQKQHELRDQEQVQYFLNLLNEIDHGTRNTLLQTLCDGMANHQEQLRNRPAFGVSSESLEELLEDEEELGCPPMMVGRLTSLLGTVRLLAAPVPSETILASTVKLLCRYGSEGITDRFGFYSPALDPARPDFEEVFREVLRPGRTISEWLAKLQFLRCRGNELPPSLAKEAHRFLDDAREILLHAIADSKRGWLLRLTGHSFGSQAGWSVFELLLEAYLVLAECQPTGALRVLELLQHRETRCWLWTLERLGEFPWQEWAELGEVTTEQFSEVANLVILLLEKPECLSLLTGQQGTGEVRKGHWIPLGLVKLLIAMETVKAPAKVIHALNDKLCTMILVGQKTKETLFHRVVFSTSAVRWFSSRRGNFRLTFLQKAADALLHWLAVPRLLSTYFDGFEFLGNCLPFLTSEQINKLETLLVEHLPRLKESMNDRDDAIVPVLYFAARVLKADVPRLRLFARELIQSSPPEAAALVHLVATPRRSLGRHWTIIEGAVRHCLLGLAREDLPWFGATRRQRRKAGPEIADELIMNGLEAVHAYLFFHRSPTPSGWIEAALAHIHSPNTAVACRALNVLALSLEHTPRSVDPNQAVRLLAWALVQKSRDLSDKALYVAARFQRTLRGCDTILQLDAALDRINPPRTLSSNWVLRLGSHQGGRKRHKQKV